MIWTLLHFIWVWFSLSWLFGDFKLFENAHFKQLWLLWLSWTSFLYADITTVALFSGDIWAKAPSPGEGTASWARAFSYSPLIWVERQTLWRYIKDSCGGETSKLLEKSDFSNSLVDEWVQRESLSQQERVTRCPRNPTCTACSHILSLTQAYCFGGELGRAPQLCPQCMAEAL